MVGAGPAGLAFATTAAQRGIDVTLFDAAQEIGGQFNVAKQVPGKEEFYETLRYFGKQIELTGVKLQLGRKVSAHDLVGEGYEDVVLATGIAPRMPEIAGIDHPKVLGYLDVLRDKKPVGKTVAVIGAGGIGFDVSEYLLHEGTSPSLDPAKFFAEWGVDTTDSARGGIQEARIGAVPRKVYLLQRKTSKVGDGLGKTTGWIHRTALKNRNVEMIPGVSYRKVDDAGLHITVDGNDMVLSVDNVVLCAGQDPQRELQAELLAAGCTVHLIGGADKAAELDAKRAIKQGTELALGLDTTATNKSLPQPPALRSAWRPRWQKAWRNGTTWWHRPTWPNCPPSCTPRPFSARPWRTRHTPARRLCSSSWAWWSRCLRTSPTTASSPTPTGTAWCWSSRPRSMARSSRVST